MMKRIKAKEDLFKKLQDLDEKRLDLSEIKENDGSVLEPSAAGGKTDGQVYIEIDNVEELYAQIGSN